MTTTATAALEIKTWVHPGTGVTRRYVNNVADLIKLEVAYYNTGNIKRAALDGEHISNAEAGRILSARVWLDDADTIHIDHWHARTDEQIVIDAVTAALDGRDA